MFLVSKPLFDALPVAAGGAFLFIHLLRNYFRQGQKALRSPRRALFLRITHVLQKRNKCLVVFFCPTFLCLCCFQAPDFNTVFFRCAVNDLIHRRFPEYRILIFLQISSCAHWCTIPFAFFQFQQSPNAKVVSHKERGRVCCCFKDSCTLSRLF